MTSGGVEGRGSVDLLGEAMERRRDTWDGHAGRGEDTTQGEARWSRRVRRGGQEGTLWATT
ncbi:MAG: hypothetical protein IJ635_01225 [Bacteroidaceae bacterium]|nr:hypothetical protein [Bacteroidaceae bacterium]